MGTTGPVRGAPHRVPIFYVAAARKIARCVRRPCCMSSAVFTNWRVLDKMSTSSEVIDTTKAAIYLAEKNGIDFLQA